MKAAQKTWGWYLALPPRNKIGLSLIFVPIVLQAALWVAPKRQPTCSEAKVQQEFLRSQPATTANFKAAGQNAVDVLNACIKRK